MYHRTYGRNTWLSMLGIVLVGSLLTHCGSSKGTSSGSALSNAVPTITEIELNSSREIIVTWSKAMESQSALTLTNYQLDQGLRVKAAKVIDSSGTQIALYTDKNMLPKKTILSVGEVTDTYGKTSISTSKEFTPNTKIAFVSELKGTGDFSSWIPSSSMSDVEAANNVARPKPKLRVIVELL
ncbi:MAG: hypothetical protein R3A11_02025 [Bdellovibrionota bacterium]